MTTPLVTPIPAPTQRLLGKRIVVTGGARGIGAEMVARFRSEGAAVAVLDRLGPEGLGLAESLGCEFVEVDLAEAQSAARATEEALQRLGGIDVLVNNAGILRLTPLLDIRVPEWDEMFAINTRAMLVTIQTAASAMIAGAVPGKIINLASMAAKTGGAGQAHYAASKAAVVALTRAAALELGPHGITANCLCPGFVLTDMGADSRTQDDITEWSSFSPLGRLGTP
ncbi:MAG TPA: SDR family oxidoreductase, partial [Microbacterium sp.]|nr:SDR family oxidoreductase [Microbacterium sp.]